MIRFMYYRILAASRPSVVCFLQFATEAKPIDFPEMNFVDKLKDLLALSSRMFDFHSEAWEKHASYDRRHHKKLTPTKSYARRR